MIIILVRDIIDGSIYFEESFDCWDNADRFQDEMKDEGFITEIRH